ncbi:hypothetical protein LXL04_017196 [Taraxacum kok-saghyz]
MSTVNEIRSGLVRGGGSGLVRGGGSGLVRGDGGGMGDEADSFTAKTKNSFFMKPRIASVIFHTSHTTIALKNPSSRCDTQDNINLSYPNTTAKSRSLHFLSAAPLSHSLPTLHRHQHHLHPYPLKLPPLTHQSLDPSPKSPTSRHLKLRFQKLTVPIDNHHQMENDLQTQVKLENEKEYHQVLPQLHKMIRGDTTFIDSNNKHTDTNKSYLKIGGFTGGGASGGVIEAEELVASVREEVLKLEVMKELRMNYMMEIPTNQGFPYVYNKYNDIPDHKDTGYPIYVIIT